MTLTLIFRERIAGMILSVNHSFSAQFCFAHSTINGATWNRSPTMP